MQYLRRRRTGRTSSRERHLPLGTAYAIWTGIGVVCTALFGIALLGESAAAARLVCIVLIVAGVIGLKIVTPAD